jgi:simple sugar transport system ATP-binding protein
MSGVDRRFGSVVALDGAGLEVVEGEVHAVLGENGAGKSTLMRILAGLDTPDDGEVVVGGVRVEHFDPLVARRHGVAIVQQHFTLVPTISAADNVTLARPLGRLRPRRGESERRLASLVERYGLDVRPGVVAGELSVGEQQRLEVLRALDADPQVLVLDEPTALLTDAEAGLLLDVCRRLADEGRSVVIVTHRMAEVAAAADRVTILRRARTVLAGEPVGNRSKSELARLMVGDDQPEIAAPARAARSDVTSSGPRLQLTDVSLGRLRDASFSVGAGQVVGIAGVDGNGQAELEAALSGRLPIDGGTMELDGSPLELTHPADRIHAGIAYITSDRYRWGLVGALDLADNLLLGRFSRWLPSRKARHAEAAPRLDDWDVRSNGPATRAGALSGGNAQKVVLARELEGDARLVLACHVTRGLDPHAAATVATRVLDRATNGAGVVWIGAELDELFDVADEIHVAVAGTLVGPFHPPYDRNKIGLVMAGEKVMQEAS